MLQPTFNTDGYPTEATLDCIRNWLHTDPDGVLRFICAAWHWPEFAREVRPGIWSFGTGGWSGNEDVLAALRASVPWLIHFASHSISLSGGLLCIAVGENARREMNAMQRRIAKWCWRKSGGKAGADSAG